MMKVNIVWSDRVETQEDWPLDTDIHDRCFTADTPLIVAVEILAVYP